MPIPASAIGAGLILLAACLFSSACAYRFLSGQRAATGAGWRCRLLAGCGVGTLVFGCRLFLADGNVSWAPYLDQWNAEISGLVAPLAHGRLGLGDLLAANNEHRVVLTRIVSLAAVAVNGGWDNRVMALATFLLQSAAVAWVCLFAWTFLGWARGSVVASAALLPMLLVCDWENIVSGFQDQFAIMVLGSVVAFSLPAGGPLRSPVSWAPLLLAAVMLGSMASGFFTALAMAGTGLVTVLSGRRSWRSSAWYLGACTVVAAIGWLTRHPFPPVPSLYAQGLGAWMSAFLAYASWPLPPGALSFIALWLPWCALLLRTLRRREEAPLAPFVISLGFWVLLQAGALAWARASLSGLVGSRYTDVLAWGFVANAAAVVVALPRATTAGRMRILLILAVAAWLGVVGASEVWRSRTIYRPYFEGFRRQTLEHERRLEAFTSTGDAGAISGVEFPHIPGTADEILSLLRDTKVRALLSGPLRRGIVGERGPSATASAGDGPLSFAAVHAMRNGPWFALAGVAMLAAAAVRARRNPPEERLTAGRP